MQLAEIAPVLIWIAVGVVGWFTRSLWDADKELRDSLSRLREEMPRTFVLRDDYKTDMVEIKSLLRDIRQALDGKADKGDD